MTTLRTALRSAIEAGDPTVLTRAGFGSVDTDELRQALLALATQSPTTIGAALDAAATEPDVGAMLTSARAVLTATPPEPLGADLVAGAAPTDDLDFARWHGAPTGGPEALDPHDFTLDPDDDLDFGSGGEAAADHHLVPDLVDDRDAEPFAADESMRFDETPTEETDVDDPFAIGANDLDGTDDDTDLDGADDDFL